MSDGNGQVFEDQVARLQDLLTALDSVGEPSARSAAQELVQVVIGMHSMGLAELLAIVREAGSQPADTLLAKFASNPSVRGLLLLHDQHPDDLATRASEAVHRLRPHLGVEGAHAELAGVEDGVIRIRVTASGQTSHRPTTDALRREIEETVLELAPDADDVRIEGLESTSQSQEAYVPLSAIARARAAAE